MPKFVVHKRVRYGGKDLFPGDQFEAPDSDRSMLVLERLGRIGAVPVTAPRQRLRRQIETPSEPVPEPPKEPEAKVVEPVAEAGTAVEPMTTADVPGTGEYERRDMEARRRR